MLLEATRYKNVAESTFSRINFATDLCLFIKLFVSNLSQVCFWQQKLFVFSIKSCKKVSSLRASQNFLLKGSIISAACSRRKETYDEKIVRLVWNEKFRLGSCKQKQRTSSNQYVFKENHSSWRLSGNCSKKKHKMFYLFFKIKFTSSYFILYTESQVETLGSLETKLTQLMHESI